MIGSLQGKKQEMRHPIGLKVEREREVERQRRGGGEENRRRG